MTEKDKQIMRNTKLNLAKKSGSQKKVPRQTSEGFENAQKSGENAQKSGENAQKSMQHNATDKKSATDRAKVEQSSSMGKASGKQAKQSEKSASQGSKQRTAEQSDGKNMENNVVKQKVPTKLNVKTNSENNVAWIAIASVFVLFTAILSFSTIYYSNLKTKYEQSLNSTYEKHFFDSLDGLNNLGVNLSKLMVSNGDASAYLTNVKSLSTGITDNLSAIPVTHEAIMDSLYFVNQVGDYSDYLKEKLKTETLSSVDKQNVQSLYATNTQVVQKMNEFYAKIIGGYKFTKNMDTQYKGSTYDTFSEMQSGSIEYPKLIYDGPFSQSIMDMQYKGLPENEVTSDQAEDVLKEIFSVDKINYLGMTEGKITTFNFSLKQKETEAIAQMSKLGGKLILYSYDREIDNVKLSNAECIEIASKFVEKLTSNMTAVWNTESDGILYVNFIFSQDNISYYSDMIIVKVAKDDGEILGYEAVGYYSKHTARESKTAQKTLIECRQNVFDKLEILSEKLVVIPTYNDKEVLAYEFYGIYENMLYFIYIDANTGEQVNIFRVIDSEQGSLVM